MNWTTLYITGRSDFRDEVRRKLEGSLDYMPGYIESSSGKDIHDLFWINDQTDLRDFKQAIGSKLIWKYRLRFYTSLEEFIQAATVRQVPSEWTEEERELLTAMRRSA